MDPSLPCTRHPTSCHVSLLRFFGASTVTWYATPEQKLDLKVTNVPNILADAELV